MEAVPPPTQVSTTVENVSPTPSVTLTPSQDTEKVQKIEKLVEASVDVDENTASKEEVAFNAIAEFVSFLWTLYSDTKDRNLRMFYKFVEHVRTEKDSQIMIKLINEFDQFFKRNLKAISNRNLLLIQKEDKIVFSEKIHLDIQSYIWKTRQRGGEMGVILRHLLTIYAILNLDSSEDILKELESEQENSPTSSDPESETKEDKFIGDILEKTKKTAETLGEVKNPQEVITKMLESGIITELMNGISSSMNDDGSGLRQDRLLRSLQNSMGKLLGSDSSKLSGIFNMASTIMGNVSAPPKKAVKGKRRK